MISNYIVRLSAIICLTHSTGGNHSMSISATINSVAANARSAFFFPIVLLACGFQVASAQCSQATQPEAASPAQPAASLPGNPPTAANGESSSSSETANGVRFAIASAITVLEETPLQVITDAPISSRTTKAGAKLSFTLTRDVVVDDILVIPCGATVFGTVVQAKQAGRLVGASSLTLQLTALNLGGSSYPLYTPPFKVVGQSKTRPTTRKIATGAAVGALAADSTVPLVSYKIPPLDRAKGDAFVAGVGAGVGTAVAAISPPSIALIPAESQIEFTLASPIAVFPVDQRTAVRLAQGMRQGGPVLYIRGESQ
jgi:hypothetical protein